MLLTSPLGVHSEVQVDEDHPWPGLISFGEADHSFFFGREREVVELARIVRQQTVTVFFGKSGLGKSSILRAGVSPVLRESAFIPIYIRLNQAEKSPPLGDQVKIRIEEIFAQEQIEGPKPVREETLWEYFHKKECDWWTADNRLVRPVLIFDQFEELLTTGQSTPLHASRTAAFLGELEDLVENRPPDVLLERFKADRELATQYDFEVRDYRIVLTLREDFLPDLEGLRERLRPIMFNRFRLLPMSGTQALDVILKPGGHLVDEQVAIRIVDFVSSSQRSRLQNEISKEQISKRAVEPALLSVILQELNNRRILAGQEKITAELVGNAEATEIFYDFYQRGLQDMDASIREFIEDYLLTSSGARNRIAEEDALTKHGIPPEIISTLIDRRVIQRETTGAVKWLELTHDTLADVVRSDRSEHHQRRQIEAAAARVVEVRNKLRRARILAAAFGVLLLLMVLEYLFAENQHRTVIERTESHAQQTVEQLRSQVLHPVAAGNNTLREYMRKLSTETNEFGTQKLKYSYCRALTYAAEISYFHGYITEGLEYANTALGMQDGLKLSVSPGYDTGLLLTSAHYAVAEGNLAEGLLDKAEAQFSLALSLVGKSLASSKSGTEDEYLRLGVLSNLGLAEVKLRRGLAKDAETIFSQVRDQMSGEGVTNQAQSKVWLISALEGLGSAEAFQMNNGNASKRFKEAQDTLLADQALESANSLSLDLVWRKRRADLLFRQAFASLEDSVSFGVKYRAVQSALEEAEELWKLDPENLDWKLLLANCWKTKGMFDQSGGEFREANKCFKTVIQLTDQIRDREQTLFLNNYLFGIAHYYLATNESEDKTDDTLNLNLLHKGLATLVKDGNGNADYVRAAVVLISKMGEIHAGQKKYDDALVDYKSAFEIFNKLPNEVQNLPRFQRLSARLNNLIASALIASGGEKSASEAINFYGKAANTRVAICQSNPCSETYVQLSDEYLTLGDAYFERKDSQSSLSNYRHGLEISDQGLARFPNDVPLLQQKAYSYWVASIRLRGMGNLAEAVRNMEFAAASIQDSFEVDPMNIEGYKLLTHFLDDNRSFYEKSLKTASLDDKKKSDLGKTIEASLALLEPLLAPESENWTLPPLFQGSWRTLAPNEKETEARYLLGSQGNHLSRDDILRIRALVLSFYTDTVLFEAEVKQGRNSTAILSYIRCGDTNSPLRDYSSLSDDELNDIVQKKEGADAVRLDGHREPIEIFNQTHPPILDNASRAVDYLRFFCGAIKGKSYSTLRIVDRGDDLHWKASAGMDRREEVCHCW
jgi:tetratricopeptide (TPR) repeat protein